MLEPKDDQTDHDEVVAAVAAKIATQGALLSGLDPIDHDRADVRRLRERSLSIVPPAAIVDDAKG